METPQPLPPQFQPIGETRPPASPVQPAPAEVSKTTAIITLTLVALLGIAFGLYQQGIIFPSRNYPVLSDPSKTPPTEVPAVFSQSGTVMAITSSKLTIRYMAGADYKVISFPLLATTDVYTVTKDFANGKPYYKETPARITDIKVGATVAVQIPSKTLVSVTPTKIQILPQ